MRGAATTQWGVYSRGAGLLAAVWRTYHGMSGFKDHFLDKYFAYRAKYVAYIGEQAPQGVRWAIASEIARLSFVFLGSGFCALLFWLLTGAAAGRGDIGLAVVFGACGALGSLFALLAAGGGGRAVRALMGRRG